MGHNGEPLQKRRRKASIVEHVRFSRQIFDLPVELLWHIWSYLRIDSILTFSCSSHSAYASVCDYLKHLTSLLVVRQNLNGSVLLSLVNKLQNIKLLSIVCGKMLNCGFEFSTTPTITFQDVTNILSSLPSKDALVDMNGGNCHLGDMNNLRILAETSPHLFGNLANLHVCAGLSKEIIFDIVSHASNLRALTLDHCIVDLRGPPNNQGYNNISFPCLSYLNLCGVSFVYSNSLARLLYACCNNNNNTLHTFEMYGCIGYVDAELDYLVSQQNLKVFTLKQQCQLTPRFVNSFRTDSLKSLSLDSVHSLVSMSRLISTATSVVSLELANIGRGGGLFEQVGELNVKNTNLRQLALCNCIEPEPPTHPLSGAELSSIVTSFPNIESLSLHQFRIQALPEHLPNLATLTKLSLEYMQCDVTEVEKIIKLCPKLEMLSCVALRTLASNNDLHISSPTLQRLAIKECLVSKIIVNNAPSIRTLSLSYMRNSDLLFSILGQCQQFSTIEVKRCDSAVTESIVNAVITASKSESVARIKHFVKVKSWFSGSLEDVENEIFWSFHGHVAVVRKPVHHTHTPELDVILRAIKDRTKCGVPYGSTMSSLLRTVPPHMVSANTHLRTNFPLSVDTTTTTVTPPSNYNKCLVILTNVKDGRIL